MIVTSGMDKSSSKIGHETLYVGGITAILASTCHHISFLLSTLGLSETRIVYIVTMADWARPFLIIVTLISLFISHQYIWGTSSAHSSGKNGTASRAKVIDRTFYLFIAILVVLVLMLPYIAPCTE